MSDGEWEKFPVKGILSDIFGVLYESGAEGQNCILDGSLFAVTRCLLLVKFFGNLPEDTLLSP